MKHIFKIIFLALNIFACTFQQNFAMTPDRLLNFSERIKQQAEQNARAMAQESANRQRNLAQAQRELAILTTNNPHPTVEAAGRIAELQANITNLQSQETRANALDDAGLKLASGLGNWATNTLNQQNKNSEIRAEAEGRAKESLAKGLMANEGALQRLQYITEPKTLGLICLTIIGIIGGYYAVNLTYEEIKKRLGVPELVDETSRAGFWQNIVSMFSNEAPQDVNPTQEIILSPEKATIAGRLADDAKETNALHLPYQNALFEGPPGTGKTAFAKILAYYSGMDYAILSGSRFAQFKSKDSIKELFKIISWAEANDRGTIIFIDEADALFRDRKTLKADAIKFLEAFLSKTGGNSDKFMIIFATNYADELDTAILDRIHKIINFPLPELAEREKILQLKINKYIANDTRTYTKDDNEVTETLSIASDITPEYLNSIAQKMENFSGRSIDYAVAEMRLRCYRSGKNILTKEIVDMVINEKIAQVLKNKKTSDYQELRHKQKLATTQPAFIEPTASLIEATA